MFMSAGQGSVGFWKVKVVQGATEIRGLLLFLWREVALLDDLYHLIERTPPPPLAYSPRREGCTVSTGLRRPGHSLGRDSISPRAHTSTSPPISRWCAR
jgi:hypothetical protein